MAERQIPYLICALFFGLPMVYAEFMIGQYSRSGPGLALGRYAAGMRGSLLLFCNSLFVSGIGWSMVINSISLSVYYCVIIAWCGVYFSWVVSGESWRWTECSNWWNTEDCVRSRDVADCRAENISTPYFYRGNCTADFHNTTKGATEEFFTYAALFFLTYLPYFSNYMTTRSTGIMDFHAFNWPIVGALALLWLMTCAILLKGIHIMGYLSYVIVPFPYVIVCILFVRGITLSGARKTTTSSSRIFPKSCQSARGPPP